MSRALLIPDCHAPYHDKKAFELVLKTGPYDIIVVLGDLVDCATVSKHDRSPHRLESLEQELTSGRQMLEKLAAIGKTELILCEGNHEVRLRQHAAKHAPALLSLVGDVADYIDPKGLWTRVPYGELYKIGKLYVTHDQGPAGAGCAAKTQAIVGHNVAHGHSHRLEMTYTGTVTGDRRFGMSCGHLVDTRSVAVKYATASQRAQWQLGFGVAHLDRKRVFAFPVPIVKYTCVVDGKLYRLGSG